MKKTLDVGMVVRKKIGKLLQKFVKMGESLGEKHNRDPKRGRSIIYDVYLLLVVVVAHICLGDESRSRKSLAVRVLVGDFTA